MCLKQLQRAGPDGGEIRRIRVRKFAPDPRGRGRVAVIRSAFVRFRYELLQQSQIAGVMDSNAVLPVYGTWG